MTFADLDIGAEFMSSNPGCNSRYYKASDRGWVRISDNGLFYLGVCRENLPVHPTGKVLALPRGIIYKSATGDKATLEELNR